MEVLVPVQIGRGEREGGGVRFRRAAASVDGACGFAFPAYDPSHLK